MKRFSMILVVIACMLLMTPTAFAASRQSTGTLAGVARGNAFAALTINTLGSSPGSGSTTVGPLADVWLGCSLTSTTSAQDMASASIGSIMTAGAVQDVVSTTRSASSISSQAESTIKSLDILHGMITAGTISALTNSTGTASGATSSNDTTFSGLSVLGHNQSTTPAPNTTVKLPGLGYVVLNEQFGSTNSYDVTGINVYAIDVYVNVANKLGLGVGSRIIIGHANSYFLRTPQSSMVSASSYSMSSSGTGDTLNISSGANAPAAVDCAGGNSQQQSSGFSSSTLGNTGTVNDSASGQITAGGSQASAQSNIHNLNLLGGLIRGDAITVQANAGWNGQGSGSASTTLSNMQINGILVSGSPSPNMTYTLPGLGTVALNEQSVQLTSTGVSSDVLGMVITITQTNPLGLPAGAQIIIGGAGASVSI